jgi:hypothetical protein
MIRKLSNINERKLTKIIDGDLSIVNIKKDGFQYSNGCIVANCTYENDIVIQKLFSVGAIKDYRNWTPKKTMDLSKLLKIDKEIEAEKTRYLYKLPSGETANIFKADGAYHYIQKQYVDVFKDVNYSIGSNKLTELPFLVIRGCGKELVGVILPVRVEKEEDNIFKIMNARG